MVITSEGYMSQQIILNDNYVAVEAWILDIIDNNTLKISSGGCIYNLNIELNGNILTTTLLSGVFCGMNDFTEIDIWEKISSKLTVNTRSVLQEDEASLLHEDKPVKGILGGAIGANVEQ